MTRAWGSIGEASEDPPLLPPGLTPSQLEAITADDPILCVMAGAGAGKTRVLTLRVARRIDDGSTSAPHTLVCTFSRKAADELRQRLWTLGLPDGVRAGTFHRLALSLLTQHAQDRGLAAPTVMADRRRLLGAVLTEPSAHSAVSGRRAPTVAQLEAEVGWAKARLIRPSDYEAATRRFQRSTRFPAVAMAELYERYETARQRQRVLDFDDLLWACSDMLADDTTFADAVRWRFRHLYVDEMQDVNPAQFRLLTSLLGDEPDLFVVGDPNQSVYGWNGADPSLLQRVEVLLPGTRVIHLDENHRCSPQVVRVASAALGLTEGADGTPTSGRMDGPVPTVVAHFDDTTEAAWVARQSWLSHAPGRRWSSIAVLARTNAQLNAVAEAMAEQRIPVTMAGVDTGPVGDLRSALDSSGEAEPVWNGEGDSDEDGDGVVLSTFHRAKGLEWPTVFVIGLSDGLVPFSSARTDAALDEERRLLYVALTRSERELWCSWSEYEGEAEQSTKKKPRQPSRWLDAIDGAIASLKRQAMPSDRATVSAKIAELRAQLKTMSDQDR